MKGVCTNPTRGPLFLLLILIVLWQPAQAQTHMGQTSGDPKLEQPLTIEAIEVVGRPGAAAPAVLLVRFTPMLTAEAILNVALPGRGLDLAERAPDQRVLRRTLQLRQGVTQTERFALISRPDSRSLVHLTIDLADAPADYARAVSRHVRVETTRETFVVKDPRHLGEQVREIGKDVQRYKGASEAEAGKAGTVATQSYSISFSGQIESFIESSYRGLYGNDVVLWFRDSSDPDMWYHPRVGNQQHVHYDVLDEQGHYAFNFSFTGNLSSYDEAIILVNTANDATFMPAPSDGYIEWNQYGYTAYFNELEGVIFPIDGSASMISGTGNGVVNSKHGNVLRSMQMAREFVAQRDGEVLSPIQSSIVELNDACGIFRVNWDPINGFRDYILVDPLCANYSTSTHEYGHYMNYVFWEEHEGHWISASDELQEGWAIAFSFMARNYGHATYGDPLIAYDDNPEEDAFEDTPYRYYGIDYAAPSGANKPSYAAAACFIWNLYDAYDGGGFEALTYNEGDNDDVGSLAQRVFDILDYLDGSLFNSVDLNDFKSQFKSGLSTELQASVDNVYNFMFDNLTALPSSRPRPPQAKNLTAQKTSGTQVQLQWASQVYAGTPFYTNPPTGYRVYKDGGLIATLSSATTSYTYNTSTPDGQYKVSAYNAAGDAANAPVANVTSPPPAAPTNLTVTGTTGQHPYLTWNASSGATGYKVYRCANTYYTCSSFFQIGSTTSTSFTDTGKIIGSGCLGGGDEITQYYVKAYNTGGDSNPSNTAATCTNPSKRSVATDAPDVPATFALHAAYPNPFNPATEIRFDLPEAVPVTLVVYDATGREVARLVDGPLAAATHAVTFDATDLPSGVYLVRLAAGPFAQTRRVVLLK